MHAWLVVHLNLYIIMSSTPTLRDTYHFCPLCVWVDIPFKEDNTFTDCPNKTRSRSEADAPCNKTLPINLQDPKYMAPNISKVFAPFLEFLNTLPTTLIWNCLYLTQLFQVNSSEPNLWVVGLTIKNITTIDTNITYRLNISNAIGFLVSSCNVVRHEVKNFPYISLFTRN